MSCPKPSVRSPKAFSCARLGERLTTVLYAHAPGRNGRANDNSCPSGSSMWKYRSPPRSILRLFGLESQLVEASPERVHIRHMEDKPTPAVDPLTLLQIEDGRVRVFRTQGRETRSSSAVEHLHAEDIPIELHGGLHVRDSKRDRRNPLNFHRHAGSLLPPERAALARLIFA